MSDDGADPSQDVHAKTNVGVPMVVHLNHLSQESLSSADWYCDITIANGIFYHLDDVTVSCGRILDYASVSAILRRQPSAEMNLKKALFVFLNGDPHSEQLSHFFRKEVVDQTMSIRGFVDYNVDWGSQNVLPYVRPGNPAAPGPAGVLGEASVVKFQSQPINWRRRSRIVDPAECPLFGPLDQLC